MVAAGMSGSMAETPRKSVRLGFDSRRVINFPFLSNLVSCTGEHLATQSLGLPQTQTLGIWTPDATHNAKWVQPLTGEELCGRTANVEDASRLDLKCKGF